LRAGGNVVVRLDDDVKQTLERIADEERRALKYQCEHILKQYAEQHRKKAKTAAA
jgi:predicted transcriptional regulator